MSRSAVSVLINVVPHLLGSALAQALSNGVRRVTLVEPFGRHTLDRSYEVAVVSAGLPDGVDATAVIQLPVGDTNDGSLAVAGRTEVVTIARPEDIRALLEEMERSQPR